MSENRRSTQTTQEDDGRSELLGLVSHDLINQQQAALGFLELLGESASLSDDERALLGRTVEALEHTTRLLLQVRTAIVHRERGGTVPSRVRLDKALEEARRTVEGSFAKGRLKVNISNVTSAPELAADELLTDMLVQLLLLLGDPAPPDRSCELDLAVEPGPAAVSLRISSRGFALDPLVTDAITGGREHVGVVQNATGVALVSHLMRHYGAETRMVPAPPGSVGAQLVIDLPIRRTDGAVNHGG